MDITNLSSLTVVKNEPTAAEGVIALAIAKEFFGGVTEHTPQWQRCLDAARAANGADDIMRSLMGDHSKHRWLSAQQAFKQCAEFNAACGLNTEGTLTIGDTKLGTLVEQAAMVYPDPNGTQLVMAFFRGIGWADVNKFKKVDKKLGVEDELLVLGQQARAMNKLELALALLQASLVARPDYFHSNNEIGTILQSQGKFSEAVTYYNKSIEVSPHSGGVLNNRAMTLRVLGRIEEALADASRARDLIPENETIQLNLATILEDHGRIEDAVEILEAFDARHPTDSNNKYNRALILLGAGRFKEGWELFINRLYQPNVSTHYEHYVIPRWNGEDLNGKEVLIWTEQGRGDEIMTMSMVPDVINAGAKVTLLCATPLVKTAQRAFPGITVDCRPEVSLLECFRREPLQPLTVPRAVVGKVFDYQMSQGDMGMYLRKSWSDFPGNKFMSAWGDRVDQMRRAIGPVPDGHKLVGITWHSNANSRIGNMKSIPIEQMGPIFATPNVTFVNLQYGDTAADLKKIETLYGVKVRTIEGFNQMADLDGLFALTEACDAVVTVSNTTVHVAGSIGKLTFLLCPTGPGRLWYHFRTSIVSPWYSSVRIVRQERVAQWGEAIENMAALLQHWVTHE